MRALWPKAPDALTEEGRTEAGAVRARQVFQEHMPELVPALDRLAGQLDLPHAEAFFTLAALRPFWSGCSQLGGNGTLLRNYDFNPDEVEGVSPARTCSARSSGRRTAAGGCPTG